MPQFEFDGPTPNIRERMSIDAVGNPISLYPPYQVSEPYTYVRNGVTIEGRAFEVGEHFDADTNPDPSVFKEI